MENYVSNFGTYSFKILQVNLDITYLKDFTKPNNTRMKYIFIENFIFIKKILNLPEQLIYNNNL